MMTARLFSFVGGDTGPWIVRRQVEVIGEGLPGAARVDIRAGLGGPTRYSWLLRGITSNERYVEGSEREQLVAKQPEIGRPEATHAALIPIRKSPAWWSLTQDARRAVFEEQSHHIKIGLKHLPAVARRLHHCRDISETEPFDFLTWFEYAPSDERAFDDLVSELRASAEWKYVDREVDIRLIQDGI